MNIRVCPERWEDLYEPFVLDWFRAGILLPLCAMTVLALALTVAVLIVTDDGPANGVSGWASVAVAAVLGVAALWMSLAGRFDRGGFRFLRWMRASAADPEVLGSTRSALDIVSMAAGLETPPRLYIIDSESVNAFIVGRPPAVPSVLVTKGMVERFDISEQQGVFAHLLARFRQGMPSVTELGFCEADAEALSILSDPMPLISAIEKTAGCESRIEWDSLRLRRFMAVPFDDDELPAASRTGALRVYRIRRLRELAGLEPAPA